MTENWPNINDLPSELKKALQTVLRAIRREPRAGTNVTIKNAPAKKAPATKAPATKAATKTPAKKAVAKRGRRYADAPGG